MFVKIDGLWYYCEGNDIGVAPTLHFIPPPRQRRYSPYLKGREGFVTSAKNSTESPIEICDRDTTLNAVRMVLSP